MEEVHLPIMSYASGTRQDEPNQFDDRFEGPNQILFRSLSKICGTGKQDTTQNIMHDMTFKSE